MMNGRRTSYKVVQRPSRYELKQNRNTVNLHFRFAADLDTKPSKILNGGDLTKQLLILNTNRETLYATK
jgi:hypothetical protein